MAQLCPASSGSRSRSHASLPSPLKSAHTPKNQLVAPSTAPVMIPHAFAPVPSALTSESVTPLTPSVPKRKQGGHNEVLESLVQSSPRCRPLTAPPAVAVQRLLSSVPFGSAARRLTSATGSSTEYITSRSWVHNTSFYRDGKAVWEDMIANRAMFVAARAAVLRSSMAGHTSSTVRVWSVGCSSGEELFTARMVWLQWVAPSFADKAPTFYGLGTDCNRSIVSIARDPSYDWSEASLAGLPQEMRNCYFVPIEPSAEAAAAATLAAVVAGATTEDAVPLRFLLPAHERTGCSFAVEDTAAQPTHSSPPDSDSELFDLVLCRYSVLLYCDESQRRAALHRIVGRLAPGGVLVLGATDALPLGMASQLGLVPLPGCSAAGAWQLSGDTQIQHGSRDGTMGGGGGYSCEWRNEQEHHGDSTRRDDSALQNALFHASTLSELRKNLGMPARFAAVEAAPIRTFTGDRSLRILRERGGLHALPIASRVVAFEARRRDRVEMLRQQRRTEEEADVQAAAAALRERIHSKYVQIAGPAQAQRSFMERLNAETDARERRRQKLVKETLTLYSTPHRNSRRRRTAQVSR